MVGFGSLSNHFLQRSRRDGSDFNLLVIGAAGCGKSTLLSNIYNHQVLPADRRRYTRVPGTVEFIEHLSRIDEAGTTLRLKVTEVLGHGELGFGTSSRQNQEKKISSILKHVEERHHKHFDSENYAHRPTTQKSQQKHTKNQGGDVLYHAVIVFIQPQKNLTLSEVDCALLRTLQSRVNLIPIVAKADSYIQDEITRIKANIKRALNESKVLIFPNITDLNDDDWVIREAVDVRSHCPFLTIAARQDSEDAQNINTIRQYPWGTAHVDSPISLQQQRKQNPSTLSLGSASRLIEQSEHCGCGNDLVPMQKMLIRSYFEFLKRHTLEKLYENYRTEMVGNVQLAPLAPMRLSKSREEIVLQQSLVPAPAPIQDEDSDSEFKFQSASLDPIREEDESTAAGLSLSGGEEPKKKKKIIKRLKKSAERLNGGDNEIHDELTSPLPSIQ